MSVATFTAGRENGRRRPRGYADWSPHTSTRVLLDDVDDVLDRYDDHLPLTIRQVFYALVGAERLAKTEEAYARLGEHLNRARARGWSGGTCQLEALPPDILAAIVRNAIERELDLDLYYRLLDEEHDDRAELLGLPRGEDGA